MLCGRELVPIVIRLVRPFHRHAEVLGLLRRQRGQLHADLLQVQARDFFVQLLRQRVDARLVRVLVLPQIELRQRLVGEAVATSRSSDGRSRSPGSPGGLRPAGRCCGRRGSVYMSTCGLMLVCLTPGAAFSAVHLDLVVEVADVADDRLVLHLAACARA